MDVALIIAALALGVAALSAGLALGFHLALPRWSAAKRAITSACIATGLPMSIAFGGFFMESGLLELGETQDFVLGTLALVTLTLVLGFVFCLPSAWIVTEKLGGSADVKRLDASQDETELLPSDG